MSSNPNMSIFWQKVVGSNLHVSIFWQNHECLHLIFQIEYDLGLTKDDINHLISTLEKSSKIVTLTQWTDKIYRKRTDFKLIKNDKVRKAANVLLYSPTWKLRPPPMFMIIVTFLQVLSFILQNHTRSSFIYDANRRCQVWRFVTYIFVHKDLEHLLRNLILQILFGKLIFKVLKKPLKVLLKGSKMS